MEMVWTLGLVIGFIILGWHQKRQIAILEKKLASHKDVLDSLKDYLDIFDPQKLKSWLTCREETVEKQNEAEIEKLRSLMKGLVAERFETGKRVEREINAATDLMTRLLLYAPPHVREKCLEKMPNSMFKDAARMIVGRMPECGQILPVASKESTATDSENP